MRIDFADLHNNFVNRFESIYDYEAYMEERRRILKQRAKEVFGEDYEAQEQTTNEEQ